ncbi:Microtubule-nucleating Tub4p (gamma-tubulin) complex component [Maudiozyma exigua]|uniref:Spindle pole body component n=1 Tax=Maudiozyma exigua TaxID=34358 RepID=A0A9P6WC47_MAUEX|nr:Microtubule-nucleating Tub4p (gamma-tubulin) complex component [Kazachstania exigua]
MDVQRKLSELVKLIAPPTASFYNINETSKAILEVLQLPARSVPRLESVLYRMKSKLGITTQDEPVWKIFENALYPLTGMTEPQEIIIYLNQNYNKLHDSIIKQKTALHGGITMTIDPNAIETYQNENIDKSYLAPSVYAESFETLDKFSDKRSLVSSMHNYNVNAMSNNSTLKELMLPYYSKTLSENDIIKMIPYTLLGITSDMFPIKSEMIIIPSSIPNSMSGTLHLLFEGGLIYRNISSRIEYYKHVNISPLKQALILEMEKYMNEYSGLVNKLTTSDRSCDLSELYTNLYDSIIQLRTCYYIMHKFQISRGDELLSLFNRLMKHGDRSIQTVCSKFYHYLIRLYYKYLKDWLLIGKLDDTYMDEFFIKRDPNTNGLNFIIPFNFEKQRIPKFLTKNTAYNIFIIGKSYHLITTFCQELQWANNFSQKYSYRYNALDCTSRNFSGDLIDLVNEQYLEIVEFCSHILRTKYYYEEVLYMLKNILLMGRGDFMDMIFSKSQDVLSQQVNQLRNYAFTRILQDSIEESSLRNALRKVDNNFIVEKIDARLLNMGQNLLGWDVFTLDYIVHPPLSTILNINRTDGRKEYLQIFNFLWRFKRIEFFGNESMLKNRELIRSFKKHTSFTPFNRDVRTKLSKLSILRSQIQQFNYKIENYYSQFIIEQNFDSLIKKLKFNEYENDSNSIISTNFVSGNIKFDGILLPEGDLSIFGVTKDDSKIVYDSLNIDELYSLHNEFLDNILQHKLFSSMEQGKHSNQPYSRSLIFIFEEILKFIDSYSTLCEIAYHIFLQINLRNNDEVNASIEKFNEKSNETVYYYKQFQRATKIYIADLRDDGDEQLRHLSRHLR